MTLRVAHIIHLIFGIFITIIAFNLIDFLFFWLDAPFAFPVKIVYVIIAVCVFFAFDKTPNILFQIWTLFVLFFVIIAYPTTLFYQEVHASIDFSGILKDYIYNYIVTFLCYKYAIFSIQRGEIQKLISGVLILFILSSLLTIFSIPIGIFSLNYAHALGINSYERMSGVFLNPNMAGVAASLTMSLGLGVLFQNEGSIGRALLGFLGIAVGLGAIAASLSKTSILAVILILLASIFVYFSTYSRLSRPTRRLANVFFGFLFYAIIQVGILLSVFFDDLLPSQKVRILQMGLLLTGRGDKSDTSNRADLAILGFEKISERPIFGTGWGSFVHLLDSGSKTGDDVGIHNIYIRIWGEGGLLPFSLFILFWAMAAWKILHVPTPWIRMTTLAVWIAMTVYGLASHELLEMNLVGSMIGFMCALLIAHQVTEDKEEISEVH